MAPIRPVHAWARMRIKCALRAQARRRPPWPLDIVPRDVDARAPDTVDVAVVGGGILGLACAWELSRRHPRLVLAVLEREDGLARHQTGRNSGVVHAGVYYAPGSLKARLCVDGKRRLESFCAERGVDLRPVGKLIVAAAEDELGRLHELERRATTAGVPGLRRIGAAEIGEIEPHAIGFSALHSPHTGIVDYGAVADALAADLRAAGHAVATACEVTGLEPDARGITVTHAQGAVRARFALCCAGAWSDRLAERAGADPDPRILPFRGAYLHVREARQELVKGMIYPVPDPALPFLGVHLTRHTDGSLSIGPTALLVGALDAERATQVRASDARRILAWPGTPRVAWRYRRAALSELRHAVSRTALVRAAARYVPELTPGDVTAGGSGVRAQAVGRDGSLVDDFVFSETPNALHVRNAPSPAATSSLAIAAEVADRIGDRL